MLKSLTEKKVTRRQCLRALGIGVAGAAVAGRAWPAAAAVAKPVELNWWLGTWAVPAAEKVTARYREKNPNVTFKFEPIPFDTYLDKMTTGLVGGAQIDILDISPSWVPSIADQNVLITLNDRIPEVNKSDFYAGAWDAATWKGHLWAIPYRWETWAQVYNRGFFKAAGLDPTKPPKTWDEYVATARKLTTPDHYGAGLVGRNTASMLNRIVPMIYSTGGEIFDKAFKKCLVNQKPAVEALTWYSDLYLKDKVTQKSVLNDDENDVEKLFGAQKVAMHWIGAFTFDYMSHNAPDVDFGTSLVPGRTAARPGTGYATGWQTAIPKSAKDPGVSWDFVKFYTSPDIMAEFARTTPARKSAAASHLYTATRPMDKLKPYIDGLNYGRPLPAIPQWPAAGNILASAWQDILAGKQTPQQALDAAAADIDKVLARSS